MQTFNLKIVTSDGVKYDAQAESILVRNMLGNVSVLANHIDYVTALGTGRLVVTANGEKKTAVCSGGVLSVAKNQVTVLTSSFQWKEEIDLEATQRKLEKIKNKLSTLSSDDKKTIEMYKNMEKLEMTKIQVKGV